MDRPRVYLAGPDVFVPDPVGLAKKKIEICEKYGLVGVSPIESEAPEGLEVKNSKNIDNLACAMAIFHNNETIMNSCNALIANMTPFRGVSMDVGTSYEMGYMRAKGRPVFGYSNTSASYFERVTVFNSAPLKERDEGAVCEDRSRMAVEPFGLLDNLMLEGAIRATGAHVYTKNSEHDWRNPTHELFEEVEAFEKCVKEVANLLGTNAQTCSELSGERDNDLAFQEWKACREALEYFDKIIVDLRKYGFSLITVLLGANGFLFTQTSIGLLTLLGIYIGLVLLIFGLFQLDRVHEVFVRATVSRAMEIEIPVSEEQQRSEPRLTFKISYWSEKLRTATWGQNLYIFFCSAAYLLFLSGILTREFHELPKDGWAIAVLTVIAVGINWLIIFYNRKANELAQAFLFQVNEMAKKINYEEIPEPKSNAVIEYGLPIAMLIVVALLALLFVDTL